MCEGVYRCSPTFVVTSATVANARQHVQDLLGASSIQQAEMMQSANISNFLIASCAARFARQINSQWHGLQGSLVYRIELGFKLTCLKCLLAPGEHRRSLNDGCCLRQVYKT